MEITNCQKEKSVDLTDFFVKRYADIDVDTGGGVGWAGSPAYWDKTGYSVFSTTWTATLQKGKERTSSTWSRCPVTWPWMSPSSVSSGFSSITNGRNINPVAPGRESTLMASCNGTPIDFWRARCSA